MYYSKLIDFIEYKELVIRGLGTIFNFLPFQAQCKLFPYYSQHGNEPPGIAREDISLEISGTMLNIKAGNGDRKYSERVELPARVLADLAKTTYKNGVPELVFKYDRSDKKSIKVD